mgnify:CR=1 FL=1
MARKIKKFLKKAAPLLAVAGLGKAFMNARNRKAMLEGADANEGFVGSMIPTGPFITRKGRDSILADPRINKMDLSEVGLLMKKGGRVKKGFAKKKKQANKMRKK